MGYLERDGRVSRGIRLIKPLNDITSAAAAQMMQAVNVVSEAVDELLHIPMRGRIFAGAKQGVPSSDFDYFDSESAVTVARSLLPSREKGTDLFALEVKGDSMIDAMVNDGDIVIMKPAEAARNGEMVSIWLTDRDETTLKYFYNEGNRIRLQPANPKMKPIYIEDPNIIQVQGKVVMVIRQVEPLVS
jgi:repressor LexA